jgi:mannose-6-phosphate isomerase-like protein (cupin superfamily)
MSIASTGVTHRPAGRGRAFALMGSSLTFKNEPVEDGAPFTFEHLMPAGLGVPPHTERNHEAFYVLDGILEVEADGERYRLGTGDFLGIQPGVPHALHNPGPGPMRALTTVTPGANHARFFASAGAPTQDPAHPPPPDPSADPTPVMALARDCGIEFQPPPRR